MDMDSERRVTNIGTAMSSSDIDTFTAYGNIACDHIYGSMLITPNIGFNYSNSEVEGYTETGLTPAALNLVVADNDTDLFSTTVGAKVQYFVDIVAI